MGRKVSRAAQERDFSLAVKLEIADRDSLEGWPCCVWCGKPAPETITWSNAHFIGRAQGGLGIPQNGLTLCPLCHRRYDQTTDRPKMREFFREYLREKYPDWNEEELIQCRNTVTRR